jgi:hypothetical protein
MYWNAAGGEKLQPRLWLISAIPAEFNHLQEIDERMPRTVGIGRPQTRAKGKRLAA